MARRGVFGRITDFFRNLGRTTTEPRRAEPSRRPPEPRRQRESPEASIWRQNTGQRAGTSSYRRHREVLTSIPYFADMDEDEQQDFWDSYTRYMVGKHPEYRFNSLNNPFWSDVGIHPDDFDWHAWREANGYPHGARR